MTHQHEPTASPPRQQLRLLDGRFTVEHREQDAPLPDGPWLSLVRAPDGLTVIAELGPAHTADDPWVAFYSGDTAHELDLPGMLAALISPLAAAAIPVFVASTYQADLVLVPERLVATAEAALRGAGHEVVNPRSPV